MSRTLLEPLGPTVTTKVLNLTEEQANSGHCYGLTGPGGEIDVDCICVQYVDVNVDNDRVEEVRNIWNELTGGKVLHNYVHNITTTSRVLGSIVVVKKQQPKYTYTKEPRNGYEEIKDLYIKYGIVKNDEEFYSWQEDLYSDDDKHSLFEDKEVLVKEGVDEVLDLSGKTVRLQLYLHDLPTIGHNKVKEVVERVCNIKR